MGAQTFNYTFNIQGNAAASASEITQNVTTLNSEIKNSLNIFKDWAGKLTIFNQVAQGLQAFSSGLKETLAPGAALNASLSDLSAISGVTGEGLKTIETYARDAATVFGGSAAQSVESYKLLLSQLSPELAKTPAALKAMGDNIATLSKTMGGDTTAAAEVLTTAMNQYGVSLADPMEASRKMAEMMNVMAAAGKEGSAELPTIKSALEQCGMAAKAAGVSFEETNAAIQVLDKAGKKGAEGGVALRNVMAILATGRFLPKDVREELTAAGVDIDTLTDKSLSLTERLRPLQGVMDDTALLTKLFGRENSNAALALIQGIPEVDRYTEAISGTNTAFEQAGIIMDSYNERQARIQAVFDDLKISLFNFFGDVGIWAQTLASAAVPIGQLYPLLMLLNTVMKGIKSIKFAAVFSGIFHYARLAGIQMAFINRELLTGQMASIGFGGNILRATVAVARFATVGLFSGLKALGAFILSLVTGGAASATFAGIASASFATFKTAATSACRAVSIAISSIPIVGWIAAAVTALAALGIYFWNTSAKFRAVLKGLGAAFVATFKGIWDLAKNTFGAIGDLIYSAFTFDWQGIKDASSKLTGGFADFGHQVGRAFTEAYDEEMERSKSEEETKEGEEPDPENPVVPVVPDPTSGTPTPTPPAGGAISGGLSTLGGQSSGRDKIRNITVHIEKLIDRFEVNTTNLREDASRIKGIVAEALTGAVNDINYAG